jgi:hypothetical protein
MRGVKALSVRLQLPIEVLERDVDSQFLIPEQTYGLALSLGILYHLKNPSISSKSWQRRRDIAS